MAGVYAEWCGGDRFEGTLEDVFDLQDRLPKWPPQSSRMSELPKSSERGASPRRTRRPTTCCCVRCRPFTAEPSAVVRRHPQTGERHLDLLTSGLLPYWTKEPAKARRPINARSETAATSGMFKDALARRRCLVPADAFYEWKVIEGGKQPYAIAREDGQPMAFAGLRENFRWLDETVTRSFAILTTTPNAEMVELHDRMPVILERQDWPIWLGEADALPDTRGYPA
jgi:hypothetical protein